MHSGLLANRDYAALHQMQPCLPGLRLPVPEGACHVWIMTAPSTASRDFFTVLNGEHVRVLWSDLEAAFDVSGLGVNPPTALICGALVRCGAPAWVWDADARVDGTGVMFKRMWSRSTA